MLLKTMFLKTETYIDDLPLFLKLGLEPFSNADFVFKHYVGEYKHENGTVKIWVRCRFFQSWRFLIDLKVTKERYWITTEDGSLTRYWFHVQDILEENVTVRKKCF